MNKGRLAELAFIGAVVTALVLLVLRAIPMMNPDMDPAMQIVTHGEVASDEQR